MSQASEKQVQIIRYIQENEGDIDKFFKQMQFKVSQFQQKRVNKQSNEQSSDQITQNKSKKNNLPNYSMNYRGQKIYSIEELKKNYQNAIFGTKWWQLPYCRRNIIGKIQFWYGTSFIFTYMYSSYYMRKNNLTKLNFKFYRNTYGAFALASTIYVFFQSLLTEPYCDINSYHYNNKGNDNLIIARDIKKQLRELNSEKK